VVCDGGVAPLTDAIAADPVGVLGARVVDRFGPRLPFLFKVLAAAEPLSLQAHPDAAQAAEGFAAGNPNYRDPYHKPELMVAVEEFDALCGFRSPAASADLLDALEVPALKLTVEALRGPDPAEALRKAVTGLLCLPPADRGPLVEAAAAAAARRGGEAALAAELAARYPGDVGVVVALLLNRVRLAPEEAVWMPAGNLHAYLRGTGVEIMAASDNVLRGGLTPKRVDVPELLRVLRWEVLEEPVVRPLPAGEGLVTWPAPVSEFRLHRALVEDAPVDLPGDGPRIVLCLHGEVRLDDGARPVVLRGGQAAAARAGRRVVATAGSGVLYQAMTP
jgi:mannose-6-phosphate isomerase